MQLTVVRLSVNTYRKYNDMGIIRCINIWTFTAVYDLYKHQEIPITKFSSSSGDKVLLLLEPFNFFVTVLFEMLFRGRLSSRLLVSSASASARSSFC